MQDRPTSRTPTRPNVVLVTIDSLRADHCGFLGADRDLTPTMDALAEDGVAYRNAIAPGPQTFSSMPAVFTGHHRPVYDPGRDDGETHWERQLSAVDRHLDRYGSLAERLRGLGYATAGVSPNPWTSRESGWDRGFDRFADLAARDGGWLGRLLDGLPGVDPDRKSVELALGLLTGSSFFARWREVYDRALALREELSEPYFVWMFLLDTHFPFVARRTHRVEQSLLGTYASNYRAGEAMRGNGGDLPAGVRRSIRRSYRDAVRATDGFFAALREDFAADDPALFVHSDHGESLGEHGNHGHHHAEVYEENVHVPYFVHGAGASADVEAPTSLATIHDAVLTTARNGTFDPEAVADSTVFAKSVYATARAARGRRFKYVSSRDREMTFDLDRDPDERVDRSDEHPAVRRDLQRSLAAFERHVTETASLAGASQVVGANGGF